jgi:hypothetical protein
MKLAPAPTADASTAAADAAAASGIQRPAASSSFDEGLTQTS